MASNSAKATVKWIENGLLRASIYRDTRSFMLSEDSSCLRKCCCCSSLKRFAFLHGWRSVSGPSYCVGTWQTSVLMISGLPVITSWRVLPQKSIFMLPIPLPPNVNPSRTLYLKDHPLEIISRCLAADGPQTCILNEKYHTRAAGAGGWREVHYWIWKVMNTKYHTLN